MTLPALATIAALSLAILSPLPEEAALAFSPPAATTTSRHRPRSAAPLMAKGETGNKKGGGQKKRRFLQQAHPVPPPPPPRERPIGNAGSPAGFKNKVATSTATAIETEKLTENDSITSRAKRRGPPLQTGKSIEEVEGILERRWGTAQARRGRGEGDADFVLSFGDGDDDFDDAPARGGGNDLRGAAVFRRNRVVDPWAREEGLRDPADGNGDVDGSAGGGDGRRSKGSDPRRYDRQEAMLHRVRSNQERLRSSQRRGDAPAQKKRGDRRKEAGSREHYKVPIDVSRDYYDEDDEGYEGYEGGNGPGRGDRRTRGLVAPRPAGGKGSFSKSTSSSSSSSSLSGGIFSNQSAKSRGNSQRERRARVDAISKEEDKKRTKRPKQPRSKPLLDEDGEEMFLTLGQAEKIVRSILRSSPSEPGADEGPADRAKDDRWEDVGVAHPVLLDNLQSPRMSCPVPLAVQARACPPMVAGNDVLVSTPTGSGKTLAFLAPVAQALLVDAESREKGVPGASGSFPRAVVVAPGRELASQIVSVARELFRDTGLTAALAIGGTPYARNVERLRKDKPDLVVGTPGRIAELVIGRPGDKGGKLKISGLRTIVLDECDALLQYDAHKEPTVAIMQALDRQHGRERGSLQRVLCSATASDMMPPPKGQEGPDIVKDYLRPGYAHASVDDGDVLVTSGVRTKTKGGASTSARVSRTTIHGALHVPHQRLALEAVRRILNTDPPPQQVLIFVDSPRRVDIIIDKLAKMDIIAAPLHGGGGKGDRTQVSKALREGYVGVVVATELAARGIDAPYLTHVVNLDLPTDASHYAHRAGRCGRGGRPGVAVSITCDVREKGVPGRFAEELGIDMYEVEAREGKLRIIEG